LRFVTSVRNHRGFLYHSSKGGLRMSETKSSDTRKKLQQQISLLRQQLNHANNDLEFETHLHMIRDLESLLKVKS
jgi:excinuclease UvrABC helicase subunit UvrB